MTVLHLRWTGKNQRLGVAVRQGAHVGSLKGGQLLAAAVQQVAENQTSGEAERLWEGTWKWLKKSSNFIPFQAPSSQPIRRFKTA